jgi:hypothetical protein
MLLAVVAFPAAHDRGARAELIVTGFHAVAWRVAFGTETIGLLNLSIYGLRAIKNPARAVALAKQISAVQAAYPSLRTVDVRKRLLRDARGFRELCRWGIPFSSRGLRTCSPSITKYIIAFLPCSS